MKKPSREDILNVLEDALSVSDLKEDDFLFEYIDNRYAEDLVQVIINVEFGIHLNNDFMIYRTTFGDLIDEILEA